MAEVKEEMEKLIPSMVAAIDQIHEVIKKGDEIYLGYAQRYGVSLPPYERETLFPVPKEIKPEWMGWIGVVTRGLQVAAEKKRAGEY